MEREANIAIQVLLIEDDLHDTGFIVSNLKEIDSNCKVDIAGSGKAAIEYFEKLKGNDLPIPQLIILDLTLPDMSGLELLEHIKAQNGFKLIPVIILTESRKKEDVLKAEALYANSFICKPLQDDNFKEAIKIIYDFWFRLIRLPPAQSVSDLAREKASISGV